MFKRLLSTANSASAFKTLLQSDLKSSMRIKNKPLTTLLKSVINEINMREKEGKIIVVNDVLQQQIKKRQASIHEFKTAGREDLVKHEQFEVEALLKYLPKQATEEELKQVIGELIAKEGWNSPKDLKSLFTALDAQGLSAPKEVVVGIAKAAFANQK